MESTHIVDLNMHRSQKQDYISIRINSEAYTPQLSSPMNESMASQWTSRTPPLTPITPASDFSESEFTDFLNIWKTEISIPVLAYQKLLKILDQHITLKPNLQKKQQQLQTLLNYNTKLIQAMQSFQAHEKKILDISNSLVKIYAKTFKKHFENKPHQFDPTLFTPLYSIFDTFSMKDWQVDPKTIQLPKVNLKYKQYIFQILVDHYLHPGRQLQQLVKKKILSTQQNSPEHKLWEKLQQKMQEFNKIAQKTTIDNMFEVYEKKKKIIDEIKFFKIESQAIQAQNSDRLFRIKNLKKSNSKQLENFQQHKSFDQLDERFVHAVKCLHSDLQQAEPVKIRKYIMAQIQYRTKLKRRERKQKKRFQAYHSALKEENNDLKEEIKQIKEKMTELERINSEQKAQIDYLSIKTSVSKKGNSQNNLSVIEVVDTSIISGDKSTKKETARKSQLEAQLKKLDELLKAKQKDLGSLTIVNAGLSQIGANADELYRSFLGVKQVMEGMKYHEEDFLQGKPFILSSKETNTGMLVSSTSILSNPDKDLEKKLGQIKSRINQLKGVAQQLQNIALRSRNLSQNRYCMQQIALSQIQSQAKSFHHNSFTVNSPENINALEASYLNKTEFIHPPKMENKDMTISDDSQSKSSSKKNSAKDKIVKYGQFALKITQPAFKKEDQQVKVDIFQQFEKEPQQKQIENTKFLSFVNPVFSQSNEDPGFLNPIEEQEESKLQKNQSNHFQNSKFKTDGNIFESGSLKNSANFNQNFTLNNMDSIVKSRKSSESGMIGPAIEELDSFAGKINEESQELRNSQSRRGSEIEPRDLKMSKNFEYKKSKSWRSSNHHDDNKFELTSSQGYSLLPNENRHETAKSQDRSQIELNKSIFLEAKLKDVENVLLEKENQIVQIVAQLKLFRQDIANISQENQSLKHFIEANGLKIPPKFEGNQIMILNEAQKSTDKMVETDANQKSETLQQQQPNQILSAINSLLNGLQTLMTTDINQKVSTTTFGIKFKQQFIKLIELFYDFFQGSQLNSISKKISQNSSNANATKLINHLISVTTFSQTDQINQTHKNNQLNSSNSLEKHQTINSLHSEQKIKHVHPKSELINKEGLSDQKADQSAFSLTKTLSLKNNMKDTSLYEKLDKKPSLSPIKQRSRQNFSQSENSQAQKPQKSFHTPSESYLNKNQTQCNVSSFKNDENNQSISIVKKSNRTFNLQSHEEIKEFPDDKGFVGDKNQIVAGFIDDSVDEVLESQKSCQTIEIYIYENAPKTASPVTVSYQDSKIKQGNKDNQSRQKGSQMKQKIQASNNANGRSVVNKEKVSQSDISDQKQPMISISQSLLKVKKEKSQKKLKVGIRWSQGNEALECKKNNQHFHESMYYDEEKSQVPMIKISRQRSNKGQMSREKSQKSQQSQEGSQKSNQKSEKIKWPKSMGRFSEDQSQKGNSPQGSWKKSSRKLSFESQVSSLSSEHQQEGEKWVQKSLNEQGSIMYTEEEYLELYEKYKGMQACLLLETERNNKKEIAYQSFLKEIKMKMKPYSKLTLEQRLFEAQKRIEQLELRLKEQQQQYDRQIKKALQQSEQLCQQFIVKLEKKLPQHK